MEQRVEMNGTFRSRFWQEVKSNPSLSPLLAALGVVLLIAMLAVRQNPPPDADVSISCLLMFVSMPFLIPMAINLTDCLWCARTSENP